MDDDLRWGDLLAAAQRGDAGAYRAFLAEIVPFARAVARRKGCAETLVEDVVQDSLLTIHRVRHTYEPGCRVKPWLATIVQRRAIDARRRQGRVARHEVSDPDAYETFADPEANRTEAAGSATAVQRMMTHLTPVQREAIELMKLNEMTLAEAAAESGQSVASLKVNVHRALKRLRRAFGPEGLS
ncbi:MAG: sigma-70 family RNA polymerase sigma factor [Sphingosinicella sp.]